MIQKQRKRASARNTSPIKKGFLVQVSLVLIIILTITSIHYTTNKNKFEIITYEEWQVIPGDSLWSIAEHYTPNGMDKREVIYEIQQRNDINRYLQVGQRLEIPIYGR